MPAVESFSLHQLARVALGILARQGRAPEATRWSSEFTSREIRFTIALNGPDLASEIPADIATPELCYQTRRWQGAYRLRLRAPLIVLDLAWNPKEPLRVLAFSRGEWEAALSEFAGRQVPPQSGQVRPSPTL